MFISVHFPNQLWGTWPPFGICQESRTSGSLSLVQGHTLSILRSPLLWLLRHSPRLQKLWSVVGALQGASSPPSWPTGNLTELCSAQHKDCCLFSFLPGSNTAPASPRLYAPTQPPKDTLGSPGKATFNRTIQRLQRLLPMVACHSEHTKSQCMVLFKWVRCVPCDLQLNKVVEKKLLPACQCSLTLCDPTLMPWFSLAALLPFSEHHSSRASEFCRYSALSLPYHAHLANIYSLFKS